MVLLLHHSEKILRNYRILSYCPNPKNIKSTNYSLESTLYSPYKLVNNSCVNIVQEHFGAQATVKASCAAQRIH